MKGRPVPPAPPSRYVWKDGKLVAIMPLPQLGTTRPDAAAERYRRIQASLVAAVRATEETQ